MPRMVYDKRGNPIQVVRPILETTQYIPYGATATEFGSAISAGNGQHVVRLFATTNASISWSTGSSTAATTDIALAAGVPEYVEMPAGFTVHIVSATGSATDVLGEAWLTEVL